MILGPHAVTRLRGTAISDPYSGESTDVDWTTPTQLPVAGCSVQPGAATPELVDLANRSGVVVDYTAFVPTADITEADRIRWDGDDYEIPATIQRWDFPPLDHLVVPMRRVEG